MFEGCEICDNEDVITIAQMRAHLKPFSARVQLDIHSLGEQLSASEFSMND